MTYPTDLTAPIAQYSQTSPISANPNLSPIRVTITGGGTATWDIQYPAGTSLRTNCNPMWGYNFGEFDYYSLSDIPSIISEMQAQNVRLVRLVGFFRWTGSPSKGDADSRNQYDTTGAKLGLCDGFDHYMHPATWTKLKAYANALSEAGIWFIIAGEGDCLQSGTQDTSYDGSFHPTTGTYDYSLTLPQPGETIPGGLADWGLAGGYNIYTSNFLFGVQRERLKMVAREFKNYDYLFAYELSSEPLPPSGTISAGLNGRTLGAGSNFYIYPGIANDGVYDVSWNTEPGPGNGRRSIEGVFRAFISDMSAIDPNTPFIIGGRGGYNLSPEMQDIITALSNSSGLGGNLVAANKIIATWDRLGSGTQQCAKTPGVNLTAAQMNCPLFMNQLGARNSPDDPSDYCLGVAVRSMKAYGIPGTIWEYIANTANGYGSKYHNSGTGDGNGANGTYTVVTSRTNDLATFFGETLSSLESAAIAAATAENAALFYVKPDFTNVTKSGSFPYTLTNITNVVDPLATGLSFNAVGTVTIDYAQQDGSNHSYLPDARPVLKIAAAAGNYLAGSPAGTNYWGSTTTSTQATGDENMACIIACTPTANAVSMDLIYLGNSGTVDFYPKIDINSTGYVRAQVVGDGSIGTVLNSSNQTVQGNPSTPIVVTLIKSGTHPSTAIKMWVNGIDDSATGTPGAKQNQAGTANTVTGQTVGTIALGNLSRLRIGAHSNTGTFGGTIAGWCMFRQAPSDANAHAIGKFLAALMGGGYKVP